MVDIADITPSISKKAVKTCTEDCPFIKFKKRGEPVGCEYFQRKEVSIGQPCLYDLKTIEGYVDAYKKGDVSFVKESVGHITGAMIVKINEMLHIIDAEGMTYREPILDGKGNPIILDGKIASRIVEHPLLSKIISTAKAIGFDLQKFNLTSSTSGEKTNITGNIVLHSGRSFSVEEAMAMNDKKIKEFEEGAMIANKKLSDDPVYKSMNREKE